ncbi:MAG TPA: ATP-binding protein, partial [Gemmataceae bacterium]|nr:ATP-binding protein [Gemmataceae bacterium]
MARGRFDDLPPTPAGHHKLWLFAAVLRVCDRAARAFGSAAAAAEQFRFLAGYAAELTRRGCAEFGPAAEHEWQSDLIDWEETIAGHLPIRTLRRAAGLNPAAVMVWMTAGLAEEDPRFGILFDALQGTTGVQRPTAGLIATLWPDEGGGDSRSHLRRLYELGLVQPVAADAGRAFPGLQPCPLAWDAVRGERPASPAAWLRLRPAGEFATLSELILPDALRQTLERLPEVIASGAVQVVAARGPHGNGRTAVLGAVARSLGLGVLQAKASGRPDPEALRPIGTLATLWAAMPVLELDPGPGETVELPAPLGYDGPVGVVIGRHGAISGPGAEGMVTLDIPLPDPAARAAHWRRWLGPARECADEIARARRMTAGNIRRAAILARSEAALAGRDRITAEDARKAIRALCGPTLGAVARRVEVSGSWADLAAGATTTRELAALEVRCRHRESLAGAVGPALRGRLSAGVRAMFSGPSGTGKTLAAGLLAASLGTDIFRADIAGLVSKYVGDSEKNLDLLFSRAEELDVILLLDEGDAFLTQRTSVQSSTDRYANLETNFLLQRVEEFDGILVVTTNAAERIDPAFLRRMDVVVEFRPPDPAERWAILQSHLPERHAIDPSVTREVAARCGLTGGQIRNAILH